MKICAIICEFNPFHNGHRYLLERARELSGCDAVLCVMSGSFSQRGEMCVADKYDRARHAVLGGADCVVQLPAAFAVAPAEIFAEGAVKLLSSVPDVTTVAFGCEHAEGDFIGAAKLLTEESEDFRSVFEKKLSEGESYIRSYAAAFAACGGDGRFLEHANDVLGVEYAKAIVRTGKPVAVLPVRRVGAPHHDGELRRNYSSATAIRRHPTHPLVKDNVPDFVYPDLKIADAAACEDMMRHCLFQASPSDLKRVYGCSEGLENLLKRLENQPFEAIVSAATSRRYSSARIRRILCANMLKLYDCNRFRKGSLYLKVLAVKKQSAREILRALSASKLPVVTKEKCDILQGAARDCFDKDRYAYAVFNHVRHQNAARTGYDHMIIVSDGAGGRPPLPMKNS